MIQLPGILRAWSLWDIIPRRMMIWLLRSRYKKNEEKVSNKKNLRVFGFERYAYSSSELEHVAATETQELFIDKRVNPRSNIAFVVYRKKLHLVD
jgi:hypothetical protein